MSLSGEVTTLVSAKPTGKVPLRLSQKREAENISMWPGAKGLQMHHRSHFVPSNDECGQGCKHLEILKDLAEREGFEALVPVRVH